MKKILVIICFVFVSQNFHSQDLWGMTFGGGANNMGVLFHYDASTNIYTTKTDFDGLVKMMVEADIKRYSEK